MLRSLASLVATIAVASCAAPEDDAWDFADGKGDGNGSISYGALALAKVPPAFETVVAGLAVIDDDVMPHEPKVVRKQIAELRDQVDLFAFAYSDRHGDRWKDVREALDDGYETIGAFKDLFDRQGVVDPAQAVYDPDELAELRAAAVDWTAWFLEAEALAADRDFLSHPAQGRLYDRPNDELSPYFWAAARIEPSLSRSGVKNMARLTRELLELAIDDYDHVLDLRDLHKPSNQERFHDFRKRVRGIARMPGYFPTIVRDDADITAEQALITEAVTLYGELNDLITRYAADPDDDLKDEITQTWKALREWQRDHDFADALDDLHDSIRR